MAEFDPMLPGDATEAGYREALLRDEAGRERRRARLMAALPRPEPAAMPVARAALAWRWRPHVLAVLATGLLVVAVLALKERGGTQPQRVDPRLAAASAASTAPAATVVARAEPAVEPPRAPVAARVAPPRPHATLPAPVVVADASLPQRRSENEAERSSAVEPPRPAAAPAASPSMAAPPAATPRAAETAAETAAVAETVARPDAPPIVASDRARMPAQAVQSLAASGQARSAKAAIGANADLLAAVDRADVAMARAALEAGASPQLRDAQGRTVLMLAVRTGARDIVELLLAAGARKGDLDPRGWSAADHARDRGQDELAERLR